MARVGEMIPELRAWFNREYSTEKYRRLLSRLEEDCSVEVGFRVAETPVFFPFALLNEMAAAGTELAGMLMGDASYLEAARRAIPEGYRVANETPRPHFLTADFALVSDGSGGLEPRLVEIQAFPSVFGYQAVLTGAYREVFSLPEGLGA